LAINRGTINTYSISTTISSCRFLAADIKEPKETTTIFPILNATEATKSEKNETRIQKAIEEDEDDLVNNYLQVYV
jgi:hypothetical protein